MKSTLIDECDVFFTTRDICIYSKEEDMSYNRKVVEKFLGQKLATNHPVHGVEIAEVEKDKFFYENVDGLLLKKGMAAFHNFGDCVPLVLYAKGKVIISHAGWRGTAKCMAKVSVDRLIKETGCEASDVKAIVGPSICFDCYEVGKDVYGELSKTVNNTEEIFREKDDKYFVDLKGINKQQLIECGVDMIDVCPYCTNCGEKMFYSFRYEKTGNRHSVVVKV
ncbi:MAG: laccase domain-containing protein [Alphaproteobacteria bacterium]|nr:laccase domain-containing protein [Alphaproteobacteria bacterium]